LASSNWQDKQILITGAGGFIGSHLAERLVRLGARVRAFVRYNSRADPGLLRHLPPEIFEKLEIIAGDLRDLPAVSAALRDIEVAFHLGALIAIPYSYLHPTEVVESNILGTLNVLTGAREMRVQRLVHTSTSEVYGTALYTPIDEAHPLQGQSPYSASKIGADKLVESFYRSFDLPTVTLRPFNTYGPRQSARAVIPTIIVQALSGNVLRLGNLDARRDFTYISDTVAGFIQAGQTPGIEGQTFNLGVGQEICIEDLVHQVAALLGKTIEIQVDSERFRPKKSEVQRLVSNNQSAKTSLGWEPRVPLQEGLRQTVSWITDHLTFYRPEQYQR
jgi:NAD dependent epimerase/dehydratase